MRRILALLTLLLSSVSCSFLDREAELRDLSFEVSADVAWNAERLAYTLMVSLSSGADGDYVLHYLIDSDPTAKLLSSDGRAVETGDRIPLSTKATAILVLPSLPSSTGHSITMEFSREGVSRTVDMDLPDTGRGGIGIRLDSSQELEFSRVVLTNLMGPAVSTYRVTFQLDGEPLTGIKFLSQTFGGSMDLDFARSESYTFELPYLVAGEHILQVDIKSNLGSESSRIVFTEPQRRQTALTIRYNHYSGALTAESAFNPLETAFEFTVGIRVTGSVTYRHRQFLGIADEKTESFSASGEAVSRVTPGAIAASIDGGKLKALLDEVFSHTRTDAANSIGNGNSRTLHPDINTVTLAVSVRSLGDHAGKTAVSLSPGSGANLPIQYTYTGTTWDRSSGFVRVVYPSYTVNGRSPSSITVL